MSHQGSILQHFHPEFAIVFADSKHICVIGVKCTSIFLVKKQFLEKNFRQSCFVCEEQHKKTKNVLYLFHTITDESSKVKCTSFFPLKIRLLE